MNPKLILASHPLCPYVQRAIIVLTEKGIAFERRDIDLANPPAWFQAISPLGKTPVLLVDDEPIFESAVICEYLDETHKPRLHPEDALQRARHRAWIEFGSVLLNEIWGFYSAGEKSALAERVVEINTKFSQLEKVLGHGQYFAGEKFSVVDAVFAPVFRYFDVFDSIHDFGFFVGMPRVKFWRQKLAERDSVKNAVGTNYRDLLWNFLLARNSALARRMKLFDATEK